MAIRLATVCLVFWSLVSVVPANDWPQFGGVNRDSISTETGLLQSWPEQGPQLAWSAPGVGTGYSSVAVVGDQVFTIGDIGDDQYVFAISNHDGKPLWKRRIGAANQTSYPGSRSTPTIDDGQLFAMSTEGELYCLDAQDGSVQWQKSLPADFGGQLMLAMDQYNWQWSESPMVDGNRVVVTPGASDAAMVALNRSNGQMIWQTRLPADVGSQGADGTGYCSMVVAEIDGTRQYVQLYGRGVMGVDAETGRYLWGYNRVANKIANISSPVILGNQVFVSTGYQTGSALLEISQADGTWNAAEKYFVSQRVFQNHHGGFVLRDGHIYGGHGHKLGYPICLHLSSGELVWGPQRNKGKGSASVAYADGCVYMRYENGLMVLVSARPDGYEERGSFMIPDVRAKSWSRPVISGKRLYLKEQDTLYVYEIAG